MGSAQKWSHSFRNLDTGKQKKKKRETNKTADAVSLLVPEPNTQILELNILFLFRKGSILSSSEVRNIIINYVKSNELVDETNKK